MSSPMGPPIWLEWSSTKPASHHHGVFHHHLTRSEQLQKITIITLTASTWSISTNQQSWEKLAFVPGYIPAGTMIPKLIPKSDCLRNKKPFLRSNELQTTYILHAYCMLNGNDRSLQPFQISGSLTGCRRTSELLCWEPQLVVQEIEVRQLCRILRPVGPGYVVAVAEAVGLRRSFALSFTTTFDSEYLRYWTQKYCKWDDHVKTSHKDGSWISVLRSCNTTHFKSPTTYTTSSLVSIISLTCGDLNKRDLVHFFIHPKKQKWST